MTINQIVISYRTYAKKPGFDSKSLFLTHKYLRETGFVQFAWVSPVEFLFILLNIIVVPNSAGTLAVPNSLYGCAKN